MEIRSRPATISEKIAMGPEIQPEPTHDDVISAAFRQENTLASWMTERSFELEAEAVEGYNPFDGLDERYLPYSEAFLDIESPEERRMKEAYIDQQIADRETLAKGGLKSIGWGMAAGLFDPVTLPLLLVPAAKMGQGAMRVASMTAAAGVAEATASEALLHSTQDVRTVEESLMVIGGTAVLGTALGGFAGASTGQLTKAMSEAEAYVQDMVKKGPLEELPDSVGAAAKIGTAVEEGSTSALGPGINPLIRVLKSVSAQARGAMNRLVEHNFYIGKNAKGEASEIPLETRIKSMSQGMTASYMRVAQESYKELMNAGTLVSARLKGRYGQMRYPQFMEEVGKAMRRGDSHEIPQVAAAAKRIREEVITPITKGYQRLGDLSDDLQTQYAKSYLPRFYNETYIRQNLGDWNKLLRAHFEKTMPPDEATELIQDVTDVILGSPMGHMQREVKGTTGRVKDRTIDIPDDELEPFLRSNVDDVMQAYLRSTVPELQFRTHLGAGDTLDEVVDGIADSVKQEYDALIAKSDKPAKLMDERDSVLTDLKATMDIMLGRYAIPKDEHKRIANLARGVRGLSFMANLGMMTVSALPDVARPMMQNGLRPFFKGASQMLAFAGEKSKIARGELRQMGIGVDMMLNSRMYAMADINEVGTRMERWTRTFAKYSGMNHWNTTMKTFASFVAQNRFIDDAMKYSKLSARKKERLAKAGIDEEMAGRIADQFKKHGETFGGGKHASTQAWDDRVAADRFEKVLLRDVDNTIVTPGAADRPLFMSTQTGKTLLQFKTFFLSAHNQVLIPLAQQLGRGGTQTANALAGIATGVALGMLGEYIRLHLSGRGEELKDYNDGDWIRAGIDRSGMATVPMEVFNLADRMSKGDLSKAMGLSEGSRYFYRNMAGSLLGPTFGYAEDALGIAQSLVDDGTLTASDIHAIRKLTPYQNLFYTRQLLNQAEEAVIRSSGVEDNRRKRRKEKSGYIK